MRVQSFVHVNEDTSVAVNVSAQGVRIDFGHDVLSPTWVPVFMSSAKARDLATAILAKVDAKPVAS